MKEPSHVLVQFPFMGTAALACAVVAPAGEDLQGPQGGLCAVSNPWHFAQGLQPKMMASSKSLLWDRTAMFAEATRGLRDTPFLDSGT